MPYDEIVSILGEEAEELLGFDSPAIDKEFLHLPRPRFVDEVFSISDRPKKVIANLKRMFNHGHLAGTGYLSILPVDQGVEHSASFSFAINPHYFDPENIVLLALEGGCNAVASSYGVLASVSSKYAREIPFIVKLNHNELLTFPNKWDQVMFANVDQAYQMGAAGVGATIYFGSSEQNRQIQEVREAFAQAHSLGMFTVLWCYVRNQNFKQKNINFETASDITAQAIHLGATLGADIVKQKFPTVNHGFAKVNFGKYSIGMNKLTSAHPIDMVRLQVVNAFMGRVGLVNSGGASGENDLEEAVAQAVINKRAGGMGLIMGRKAFQKPLDEGIAIMNAVQDVYLEEKITVA